MRTLLNLLLAILLTACQSNEKPNLLKTRCLEELKCRIPFLVAISRAEELDGRRIQIIGVVRSTQGGKLLFQSEFVHPIISEVESIRLNFTKPEEAPLPSEAHDGMRMLIDGVFHLQQDPKKYGWAEMDVISFREFDGPLNMKNSWSPPPPPKLPH